MIFIPELLHDFSTLGLTIDSVRGFGLRSVLRVWRDAQRYVLYALQLERLRLEARVADRNTPQEHVWLALIVLLSVDGLGTHAIMREAGVSKTVVWRCQDRLAHEAVEGLLRDKSRPARNPPLGLGSGGLSGAVGSGTDGSSGTSLARQAVDWEVAREKQAVAPAIPPERHKTPVASANWIYDERKQAERL